MTDRGASSSGRRAASRSAAAFLAVAALAAANLPAPAARAEAPAAPPVRFGSHPTYQRMVVDWPTAVGYRVEHTDRTATIVFEAPAAFREAPIAAGLGRAVAGVAAHSDGRTSRIALELVEGIELRHLRVESKVVIDLLHAGRAVSAPPAAVQAAVSRPWDKAPLRSAGSDSRTWEEAARALAPPPATEIRTSRPPAQTNATPVRPPAAPPPAPRTAPGAAAEPASAAPVRLAARGPADAVAAPAAEAPQPARPVTVPPWRKDVRAAACRGDLERAVEILGGQMAASPLDPIDWYNLTWLLRTLTNVTMEPPPGPPDSPTAEAPLVGLCSGRPVAGTVTTWQRLAHAGQFTEFLIDLAPAAAPPGAARR